MGRVPFRYMVDQLSRSDARADTVSIDGSSNGTVPENLEYPHQPSDHHDNHDDVTETQTLSASEDLTTRFNLKQVLPFPCLLCGRHNRPHYDSCLSLCPSVSSAQVPK